MIEKIKNVQQLRLIRSLQEEKESTEQQQQQQQQFEQTPENRKRQHQSKSLSSIKRDQLNSNSASQSIKIGPIRFYINTTLVEGQNDPHACYRFELREKEKE